MPEKMTASASTKRSRHCLKPFDCPGIFAVLRRSYFCVAFYQLPLLSLFSYHFSIAKAKACDSKNAGSVVRQYIQVMEYVSFETIRNYLNFAGLSATRTLK